jgi:hypothetical protein
LSDDARDGRPSPEGRQPFDPEKDAPLLSAYVDGELDAEQVARVEAHLAENQESRSEVDRLRRLKEVTGSMRLVEAPDEEWEIFWDNIYNRTERSLGWFALTLGAVIVGGFGLYEFAKSLFETDALPWFVRAGIFTLCGGLLLLLVSVIRERIYVRRRSRYDKVKR